jgi:hypothetical protein
MSDPTWLYGNRSDLCDVEAKPVTSSSVFTIDGTSFISRGLPKWARLTPQPIEGVTPFDITTFEPEPYRLRHPPMKAYVTRKGSEYIASQLELNIHASGDNEFEAQENLRSIILDTFEILIEEPEENLAPKALRQLLVLREHIEHT